MPKARKENKFQLTLAMKYENGSSNNAGIVAYEAAVAASIGLGKTYDSAVKLREFSGRMRSSENFGGQEP
ncbi:MAG: hypothetical protein KC994_21820 [Candidatus Omnitrophica bacterium]|nr:hypothetical protein [Candidatus Omnitrophota bacterium]